VLTALLTSIMMITNYNDSMADAFNWMNVVVTAANLPIYIGAALAVLVLWRRGQIAKPGAREWRWIAAAAVAAVYCVWASIGIGGKSLLWAGVPCGVGVLVYAVYWWYSARREALTARA